MRTVTFTILRPEDEETIIAMLNDWQERGLITYREVEDSSSHELVAVEPEQ